MVSISIVTLGHLHLSIVFASKARSLPLEFSFTHVGSTLVRKFQTRVKVTNTLAYYNWTVDIL